MTNDLQSWLREDRSPDFYKAYPALFTSYFPKLDGEVVQELSQAAYYYYHAMLIYDEIVDDQKTQDVAMMLELQSESIRILSKLFGQDSPFWECWKNRNKSQQRAMDFSARLDLQSEVSISQYRELAHLKANTALLGIEGLTVLSEPQGGSPTDFLYSSHKHFYTGLQLYDDVKDFGKDWELPQFNWAIYEYRTRRSLPKSAALANHHKSFFLDGQADQILKAAQEEFQVALSFLPQNKKSGWAGLCQKMTETLGGYRMHLKGYVECLKAKQVFSLLEKDSRVLPDPVVEMDETSKNAWVYLQECCQQGWVDLPHWMWLSQEEGFEHSGVHRAEVFQRSLLWECLSFGISHEVEEWKQFLHHECTILESMKSDQEVGCWSYFPKSLEIAPDIDDLAQVMIFLQHTEKAEWIEEYCSRGLEVITNQRRLEAGVWETWIVPVRNRTPLEQKQEWFNTTYWGRGPDVEVVANFAYALYCWKPERYESEVEGTVDYILREQNPKGFWSSRWYCGQLYGTYQCIRLLHAKHMDENHEVMNRTRAYLLGLQNPDGGFGMQEGVSSDPLSTSLALLTLILLGSVVDAELANAKIYLQSSQQEDGSWSAVPFIMARPSEIYKSAVMTTAWVLKALHELSH